MWVAIDEVAHTFLPFTHDSLEVLCEHVDNAVHAKAKIRIEHVSWPFLKSWKDVDCMLLYKRLIGSMPSVYGENLRALLFDIATRFVPGVDCARAIDEKAVIDRPRTCRVARALPAPTTTLQGATSVGPARPRMHGVREIIWGAATAAWIALGSPQDLRIVLNMRKELMISLERDKGISRNTCSNELGAWQKNNLK